jgi:hypothetical protein
MNFELKSKSHEYAIMIEKCFAVNGKSNFTADDVENDYQTCLNKGTKQLLDSCMVTEDDAKTIKQNYSFDGKSWQNILDEYSEEIILEIPLAINAMRAEMKKKSENRL